MYGDQRWVVSTGTSGLKVNLGCCPAAIATIIVSPIALENARITDTIIPEEAAGTITLKEVCSLVAPKAYDDSLKDFGTELRASSLSELIKGIIIIPITIPADNELNPAISGINFCKNGVTTIKAKKPYTTVGTAANISNNGLIIFFSFFGAYSLK